MNLVYDLRYAADHFPGIGTHARTLAGALLEQGGLDSVTFLWNPRALNSRFDLEPLRHHPRARWREVDVPALSPRTARATGRIVSQLEADAYLSPFWIRPEGTHTPCVLTLHDVLPLALPSTTSWPKRWLYALAMDQAAKAAAVVTSSRFSHGEILRLTRIRPERLHTIPLGVPLPGAGPQRPERAPVGPFALVVGTHRRHKGLDTLAHVWRSFSGNVPLALVAAGADARGAHPLVDAAREVPGVHLLGAVSPAELEWLYGHATLVLVPSRYEGFGLTLVEAAMRGVAVIASDIPALRETGDGVARFVPAEDPHAWAHAVRELAADPVSRARMSEAGRARAITFTPERHAMQVGALLQSLLERVAA